MISLKTYCRALRLPFLSASILPYCLGTFASEKVDLSLFFFGAIGVVCVHLFANLLNDYADSKSGADWQDKKYYGFFGGSKLIQEYILTEKFYIVNAVLYMFLAICIAVYLSLSLNSYQILIFLSIGMIGAAAYSLKPLSLAYRYCGELTVFICFGFLPVIGAYYLQNQNIALLKLLVLGLISACLTTLILIVNQVPDFDDDVKVAKFNLIYLLGIDKLSIIIVAHIALSLLSVLVLSLMGVFSNIAFAVLALLPIWYLLSSKIITYKDKIKAIQGAKLVILNHFLFHFICIISLF